MAVSDGDLVTLHRGMGLVSENFTESSLSKLLGDVAVGHTRYSTAGSSVIANAQPLLIDYRHGPLAVAHNGNLTNAPALRRELVDEGSIFTTTTDTEVLLHLIARSRQPTPEGQIREALERCEGAFTLLLSVGRTIYAVVDPRGFRPMVLGRIAGGVIVASETCALDLVGASMVWVLPMARVATKSPLSSTPPGYGSAVTPRSPIPRCPTTRLWSLGASATGRDSGSVLASGSRSGGDETGVDGGCLTGGVGAIGGVTTATGSENFSPSHTR